MYFETRKPYEQLEEIREVLVKLRSALAQHFSLEDILIDIGDRTFQEGLGDKTYAWMMGPRKSKDS